MRQYLLVICLLQVGCHSDVRTEFLTNSDYKYWDVYRSRFLAGDSFVYYPVPLNIGSYRFAVDGSCKYFLRDRSKGSKRVPFYVDDIMEIEEWKFINDSIISIQGRTKYILKLNNDTLLARSPSTMDSILLINSLDQIDGEQYLRK